MTASASPLHILIMKTSSLGDVVHTFPAVQQIRNTYPHAHIAWMVHPALIPLVALHPAVDEVIPYDRKGLSSPGHILLTILAIRRLIRARKFDIVIDFQGLLRTSLFVGLSGATRRIGFKNPREGVSRLFYNEMFFVPQHDVHAVKRNLKLASATLQTSEDLVWPTLKNDSESASAVDALLPAFDGKTLAIVPNARWASKVWPPEFFATLMQKIYDRHPQTRFVIVGGPGEESVYAKLNALAPSLPMFSAIGKTNPAELIELIRRCDALVASDTGPLHIAVALNIPTFSLFGPNNPDYSGPIGPQHRVFAAKLPCAPCMKRECPLNAHKVPCHDAISIDEIVQSIIQQWEPSL